MTEKPWISVRMCIGEMATQPERGERGEGGGEKKQELGSAGRGSWRRDFRW